jgi:exonuclease-1
MGVAGLLPQLKSITRRVHIGKYRGSAVAIDAYCLLHRGAYSCARELVEGLPCASHLAFCLARIELLERAGVEPVVVFDGDSLPNKAGEEAARRGARRAARERARALWAAGNRAAALDCYQKAVEITPLVAKGLVDALRARRCRFGN